MRSVVALALVAAIVPASSPLKGDARSEAAATHRAQVILDRVQVPGGTRETLLREGQFTFGAPFPVPVEATRGWIVTGDREALIHSFRVHPPRGFAVSGDAIHFPTLAGQPATTGLFLVPADRPQSQMQRLSLDARGTGGGKVELLAQATVAWIPPRSKAEAVPAAVTSISLAAYVGQAITPLRRTVRAEDAVRLGRVLNGLPPTHQLTALDCPFNAAGVALLTVRNPRHVRVYNIPLAGCPFVTVTVDGVRQPDLAASARLRALLRKLVG